MLNARRFLIVAAGVIAVAVGGVEVGGATGAGSGRFGVCKKGTRKSVTVTPE